MLPCRFGGVNRGLRARTQVERDPRAVPLASTREQNIVLPRAADTAAGASGKVIAASKSVLAFACDARMLPRQCRHRTVDARMRNCFWTRSGG